MKDTQCFPRACVWKKEADIQYLEEGYSYIFIYTYISTSIHLYFLMVEISVSLWAVGEESVEWESMKILEREEIAGVDVKSFGEGVNLEQTGGMTDTDKFLSMRKGN